MPILSHIPHKKRIIIFEPWNLGDLVIATNYARSLVKFGNEIAFICSPKWKEWIELNEFIKSVFYLSIPWTDKEKKYSLSKYNTKDFIAARKFIKSYRPDFIWDTRYDIRHKMLLFLLGGYPYYYIPLYNQQNVYCKFKTLNLLTTNNFIDNKSELKIFCFLGSDWLNRQVPLCKSKELLEKIVHLGKVTVILQPEDSIDKYKNIIPSNISLLKGSLTTIISALGESDLLITTDSAWAHMGAFYNIKQIVLMATTAVIWVPPLSEIVFSDNPLPASVRYKKKYAHCQPLEKLDTLKVVTLINSMKRPIRTAQEKQNL